MAGKLIRKVCFLNNERDARILDWLQSQENESGAIRAALGAYLDRSPTAATTPPTDLTPFRQMLEAVPNLSAIRQVVEAAVKSILIELTLTPTAKPTAVDEEADLTLDELNDNLVLG